MFEKECEMYEHIGTQMSHERREMPRDNRKLGPSLIACGNKGSDMASDI
jgi:hypothetical protein